MSVVEVSFWAAAAIDLFILVYALALSKRMGWSGHLPKTVLFAALAAAVFGLHHVLEIFLENSAAGLAVAESVEGVAAVLLAISAYWFYRLVKGD